MKDGCQRTIDYMRISVTDRCNLRCLYCMPCDGVPSLAHEDVLTYEEIIRICRVSAGLGIKKIKLTGGEPLVRKNLSKLVEALKAVEGICKVTLTTNGTLLKRQLPGLLAAGLDAVNISIDTLDEERYHRITRQGSLNDAMDGLFAAIDAAAIPVKVNCVPYFSDRENITAMAGLAKKYPVHVRFIEMMPIGLGSQCELCSEDQIRKMLIQAYGPLRPCHDVLGNGPCHYYNVEGFLGKIGFISAVSHKFCDQCNRVRLTADGYLKTCLQYDAGVSLKQILRSGGDDSALQSAMEAAILNKPESHHFGENAKIYDGGRGAVNQSIINQKTMPEDEHLSMFQIGG